MNQFDYIIVGGGAAGLSLAYHLGLAGLGDRRVLLLDQEPKRRNDRTWCFWEIGAGAFEPVVARSWDRLWFYGEDAPAQIEIAPYRYKLIHGSDFYRYMDDWLATQPNITRRYGRVERIDDHADGVSVTVDGQAYTGDWAFSSIYVPEPVPPGYTYWLQHFKGWEITTPTPTFDPTAATFMDFRVEQGNEVRFVYVLPYSERTALVEYTIFSPALADQAFYDAGLKHYISGQLGIASYEIEHVEYGVIPMTDLPFARRPSPHVITTGTAGGMTKASTGYTFQRIQRQSRQIVASLRSTGQPFYPEPSFSRHALLDSVLLNVLDSCRESGKTFFSQLFSRNSHPQVLRFLDEDSSLQEDLAMMTTVNIPIFLSSALDLVGRRAWKAVTTGAHDVREAT